MPTERVLAPPSPRALPRTIEATPEGTSARVSRATRTLAALAPDGRQPLISAIAELLPGSSGNA
jgi:hypothetical protein